MNNTIQSAEAWIKKHYEEDVKNHFIGFINRENEEQTYKEYSELFPLKKLENTMIEFAKYHCEEQLKAILENVKLGNKQIIFRDKEKENGYLDLPIVDKESIINAYDLNNIK